jgi:hypothetical protein
MDLLDRAAWFIEELVRKGVTTQPIVFVAHSLGGLLVKQALQFAHSMGVPEWQAVWAQTRGVVFLASPHDGSRLADFAINASSISAVTVFLRWSFRPSPILHCLQNDWSTLRFLRGWYRDHSVAAGIRTLAFAESHEYHGVLVVDASSADPGIPNQAPASRLPEDHVSIAKPKQAKHPVYERVDQLLKDFAGEAGAERAPSDLVERICGAWWGRVITPGHEGALACIRIEKHRETGHAALNGRSFDPDGTRVAEWHSVFSVVERNTTSNGIGFNYVFRGERIDKPYKIMLLGHAEVTFEDSGDPREAIQNGAGKFISIYQSEKASDELYGTANRRQQQWVRATQRSDFETLWKAVDDDQRKGAIQRTLGTVWRIAVQDRSPG